MDTTRTTWMLTDKAAEYLGMHPDTIRELFRRRDIRAVKVGKNWRTKPEWLDAYLTGVPA